MDLNQITINPRPRNHWEAIDLGMTMTKAWWWPLFLSWLIPSAVVYSLLSLIFYQDHWLALLIVWWLKPLWDRGPLHIASHRLFNDDVDLKATLKQLPRLYLKDIIPALTWRRLSPSRSFSQPLTLLENLKGQQRRQRLTTLAYRSSSPGFWLTILLSYLEVFFAIAFASLIYFFIPEQIEVNLGLLDYESSLSNFFANSFSYIAMTLIGPFYVVAGFALYINRRIQLEAWDIELRFRHLAQKQSKRSMAPIVLVLITAFSAVSSFTPSTSLADSLSQEEAKVLISDILKDPEFGRTITEESWQLKEESEEKRDNWLRDWLQKFFDNAKEEKTAVEPKKEPTLAIAFESILWALVITFILFVIYLLIRHKNFTILAKKDPVKPPPPDVLFGLDVTEKSIPDDVTLQAQLLWQQGKQRQAIGLLYRATLSLLIHQFDFDFSSSYTEQECADIVASSPHEQLHQFMPEITQLWQQTAYAHQTLTEQNLLDLCHQWPELQSHED